MITTLFGCLCFFTMPNTPSDAHFLTDEERVIALSRMRMDAHGAMKAQAVDEETFDWAWVRMALLSPNTIVCSLAWFFLLIPLYVSLRGPRLLFSQSGNQTKRVTHVPIVLLPIPAHNNKSSRLYRHHCTALHRPSQHVSLRSRATHFLLQRPDPR